MFYRPQVYRQAIGTTVTQPRGITHTSENVLKVGRECRQNLRTRRDTNSGVIDMKFLAIAFALSGSMFIGGCVSVPTGPSVMALPGTGKTYEQFRRDDTECRQYAFQQVGGTTSGQAATNAGVQSAVLGTVIGAVAGAAFGGHDGAAVGAGTGLLVGSMAGTGAAQQSSYGTQRQYDHAYIQCMYARGERVPVSATYIQPRSQAPRDYAPLAPAGTYPPPPQGSSPIAPPGYY